MKMLFNTNVARAVSLLMHVDTIIFLFMNKARENVCSRTAC